MPEFFIKRPVFAWVIAIAIILAGVLAIPKLPVERYPSVAPPSVTITAIYPGATPQVMNDAVISLLERGLSGVKNLLYFESSADTTGQAQITATVRPGTNPELAQVDVQNRLKAVEPRLPQTVRQNGVMIETSSSGFLLFLSLKSSSNRYDEVALSDYMSRYVVEEMRRIPGVGRAQNFGTERALRVWADPNKLTAFGLTMTDISSAISAQNVQIAPGSIGAAPTLEGQRVTVPLTAQGQLQTLEEFEHIVLKANPNGSKVLLSDVARVEFGAQSFNFGSRENGKHAAILGIQLAPGANAVATSKRIIDRMDELAKNLPDGMTYAVPFNTAPFVTISIEKVIHTLVEAMVLVFFVMFLFLQNIRYTLIPAIVAPIALLGTFVVMLLSGYSINVLTMFGMVLAVGIIVDDAIVVVENVERIMMHERLSPKEATIKAMREITGAVIGITLVLTAVFLPMALASGSVGAIYRQFTMSMAISILFSAFLALTLTPALCATLLKPIDHDHESQKGFFGWFNRSFTKMTTGYETWVSKLLRHTKAVMATFLIICGLLGLGLSKMPSAFLPEEDQGFFITSFSLPSDSTQTRTLELVKKFEHYAASRPGLEVVNSILGFSFAGSGPNSGLAFTVLKDWDKRNGATAQEEAFKANIAMGDRSEGDVFSVLPPAINSLGNNNGFAVRLQDHGNKGFKALTEAQAKLLELASKNPMFMMVFSDGLPPGTIVNLKIDREKAEALGVSFASIADTLSAALGSSYVNDFTNQGRVQQVIIQADAPYRMQLNDVLKIHVRNRAGGMVALSEVVTPEWSQSALQRVRYNGYPSMRITGIPTPGVSSGDAMRELETLAKQLPPGFSLAWTGQSLQERLSGDEAPALLALSMIVVFLVLAALYESWSIPLSVMMVVPLGLFGAVLAVMLRGMPNDVFFKVGLITIIGLSAKNAILIVEVAKSLHEGGMSLVDAAVQAAKQRLRPILMTSLAFTLGVVPLMIASGASAETQHAIGTGVFGGMITATVLAIFFVPVFFVLVIGLSDRLKGLKKPDAEPPVAGV